MKKKDLKPIIISGIAGLILGWIGHFGFITFDSYYNRPKLEFKIQSLFINEIDNDTWEMNISLYQENTGNSDAIYNINECEVLFSSIQKEPFKIEYNKTFNLKQRDTRIDTLIIQLPNSVNEVNVDEFSSFKRIKLSIVELRRNKDYITQRDNSDLDLKGKLLLEREKSVPIKEFVTINSKNGDSVLVRGVHSFFYHDKFYKNYFLPSDATVKHEIKDDMILIEFKTKGKPFIYFPHKDLKDKILLPNTATLLGTIERNTDNGKIYKNFELSKKMIEGDMYFILFKE